MCCYEYDLIISRGEEAGHHPDTDLDVYTFQKVVLSSLISSRPRHEREPDRASGVVREGERRVVDVFQKQVVLSVVNLSGWYNISIPLKPYDVLYRYLYSRGQNREDVLNNVFL